MDIVYKRLKMKKAVCLLVLKEVPAVIETFDILVVERFNDNSIGLPGGKVEEDETSIQALIREIKEETNLDIKEEYLELVYGCIVGDYYCETYGLKFKHLKDVNFVDMRQIEDHINPIFTKFSVNDFAIPSIFMEYNRGILINGEDIIRSLRK